MVILTGSLAFLGEAVADTVFSEDFEGVTLIDSTLSSDGIDETDYSPDLPVGWTRDNTTTPEGGNIEYFGWTVMDPLFWINQAGIQLGRDQFTNASGNIAVADPDQYDDAIEVDPNLFSSFVETPVIDLSSFRNGTLNITVDSCFAPYDTMKGLIDLSFDGGQTYTNLLTLDSLIEGDSNVARLNEALSFASGVDFAETGNDLVIRFGLTDAGNDWWWAVDNIKVTADPGGGRPEQITELTHRETEDGMVEITVTWDSRPGRAYITRWTPTLQEGGWVELDDSVTADSDTTTRTYILGPAPITRAFVQILE
jgi:hypothetical protein